MNFYPNIVVYKGGEIMKEMDYLSRNTSVIYRIWLSYMDEALKDYNIGSGQHFFLLDINAYPGIMQHELRSGGYFDKSTVTRAVKRLEEQGYIIRKVDDKDKRNLRLYTTPKAEEVIQVAIKAVKEWHNILTTNMSEIEAKQAVICVSKMLENAKKIRDDLRERNVKNE